MSRRSLVALLLLLASREALAQRPQCLPCVGIRLDAPVDLAAAVGEAAAALTAPPVAGDDARLTVAWTVPLDGTADAALAASIGAAGGTPWLSLVFSTPRPLAANAVRLQAELARAAAVAAPAPSGTRFQILWQPAAAPAAADAPNGNTATVFAPDSEYAFLLKRAAVAVNGARPDGVVVTAPLPATPAALTQLYAGDVAAYVDVVAFAPAASSDLAVAAAKLLELDPGRPAVVDALPFPAPPEAALAAAAEVAAAGVGEVLFAAPTVTPATLAPLEVLASELAGDVSLDFTTISGAEAAWSFVRGSDLALRVVARLPAGTSAARLSLGDPQLRRPTRVDLATGEVLPLTGARSTTQALELPLANAGSVVLLRVERASATEIEGMEGLAEEVTVASEREMPVEEILRHHQAFEDAQARRTPRYTAINTTHLRFLAGNAQSIEATFEGPFFFVQGQGFDWVWESFYINGVRWRNDTIPEVPLVQPEKAAAMPLEITFDRTYTYRLRGREIVDGRDAWVIDFAPSAEATASRLYTGTVWIDRELYARLRTRALQLGLEGEVISNEETTEYRPLDAAGNPVAPRADAFWLPMRVTGQQLLNVVNSAFTVEREILLSQVRIDPPDFDALRTAALASDTTMVRDTDKGLRYLVKDESAPEGRAVKEGFDADRLFLVGGTFYDDSVDYPLPIVGLNYFSLNFRETGKQVNLLFGGVLVIGNLAEPRLFGSKFDAGVDVFGIFIPLSDTLYRNDAEVPGEEIEQLPARIKLNLGRSLGSFSRVELSYQLGYSKYGNVDDTADEFVLPADHLTHTVSLGGSYSRQGYRLGLEGAWSGRSEWEAWGLPGTPERDAFDGSTEEYLSWEASLAKTWFFDGFRKFGVELDYYGGEDLDRFSKYDFGFFGGTRVRGYQNDRIRAEEATLGHLTYGLEIGKVFRLEGAFDAGLATDEENGLDNEFLAGVGIGGNFIGPWDTLVTLDLGVPVAGPDDGFVLYLLFLKIFG